MVTKRYCDVNEYRGPAIGYINAFVKFSSNKLKFHRYGGGFKSFKNGYKSILRIRNLPRKI
jgi:hypothetical protein